MPKRTDFRMGTYRPQMSTQPVPPSGQGRFRARVPQEVIMVPSFKSQGPKVSDEGKEVIAGLIAGSIHDGNSSLEDAKTRRIVLAAAVSVAAAVEALGGAEAEIFDTVAPIVESLGQVASRIEVTNGE